MIAHSNAFFDASPTPFYPLGMIPGAAIPSTLLSKGKPMTLDAARAGALAFIRHCIEASGKSASRLASEAGIAPSTVNKFLREPETRPTPSTRTLSALARAAGVNEPATAGLNRNLRQVPIVDPATAARYVGEKQQSWIDSATGMTVFSHTGTNVVAFPVNDDSLDRVVPQGALAIVDRDQRALAADAPYALIANGDTYFRVYRNEGGPERFEPASTRGRHETFFDPGRIVVVGRIIGATLNITTA